MRKSLTALTALLAIGAAASAIPALQREMPKPRRGLRTQPKVETDYAHTQSQEIQRWNTAVDAKKAAKRARKGRGRP